FHVTGVQTCALPIFRQANVYGRSRVPKQTVVESFCKALLANQKIQVRGTGRQTRNFIHVDDVVWAYHQALSPSVRGIYNLGGERSEERRVGEKGRAA